MTLQEWLEQKNLTHEEFAVMCGCTRAAVSRWASGSRVPSPKWLKVIERKTKGQVVFTALAFNPLDSREVIAQELHRKGYTLAAASKKLRIHRNTLGRYLNRKAFTPGKIVERIHKFVGFKND